MNVNKSKINLTNKICSTLFFVFTIINFTLSILGILYLDGKSDISKTILNIPLAICVILATLLNVYLIAGMIIENKQNVKNAMFYLLLIILIFSIIAYVYSIVNINKQYDQQANEKTKFTTEFWLLLAASGMSTLFAGWNCLINWNLLRPLLFNKTEVNETQETLNEETNELLVSETVKDIENTEQETKVNL